jgi:hypothetical protein
VVGWTELVMQSRRDARLQLESDVKRLGAEGVVIAGMQLRVSQRDCPVTVGRRDHIVEATLIGTAIVGFSGTGQHHLGPALTVMPLGSLGDHANRATGQPGRLTPGAGTSPVPRFTSIFEALEVTWRI